MSDMIASDTSRAEALIAELSAPPVRMGEIKKRAKTIKTDHELAQQLWASGVFPARMLAVLILDRKRLDQAAIDALISDMSDHVEKERSHLSEWLLANQLLKDKRLVALIDTWEHHASPVQRRLFWYRQARLRWTGQTPPDNTAYLMDALEARLIDEDPKVQWTMSFRAGWIGVHDPQYRDRCIALGKKAGLYKDEIVPSNCTPNYLPDFIRVEAAKLKR
ncbi:DNA alkylation repair protein [Maricaulis sp.]|uniref:DNA alkylation repair protein n=1 Tax=Maricaulis sp. TaxID=1486257 RepID=UPI002B267C86|nr:DNA alkylation repair protein [Maricaulis sp.]